MKLRINVRRCLSLILIHCLLKEFSKAFELSKFPLKVPKISEASSIIHSGHLKSQVSKLSRPPLSWFTSLTISMVIAFSPQDRVLASNPNNEYQIYSKAMDNLLNGKFEDSLQQFNFLIQEQSSPNEDVYLSKGIALEKLERWEEAIDSYKKANAIYRQKFPFRYTDDPVCISNIANAQTGLGLWEESLIGFSKAIQLKDDYLAPQIGKAFVLYQLDRKQEALTYFEFLLSKYPSYSDGRAALAIMYYENGQVDKAKENWNDALEDDSRYIDVSWVQDIRRWPPKLVDNLRKFKQEYNGI